MTKLSEIIAAMESIASPELAEPWDNVGLLIGDRSQSVTRALLAIDYTPAVAQEARETKSTLVIAYHPPLFTAIKRLTSDPATAHLHDAIRSGIAIYSPHTALDAADGGTNDVLADAVALVDRAPLRIRETKASHCKLVTFVPADALERVSEALFAAGAGKIGGNYSKCSFRSEGTGTFEGDEKSSPAVGSANVFERVPETKIETVVQLSQVEAVVAALKKSHPYEEPAFDLTALVAPPTGAGIGRFGRLPSGITLEMVANLLRRSLGIERLLIAGEADQMISRVAICAGAGGDLLDAALARKADLFITGELRHHDALRAARAGMAVICTLHSNSERPVLAKLAERLTEQVKTVEFIVSQADRDPFAIV